MNDIKTLNQRYESAAWGALFLWIGAVWLVPGEHSGMGWLGIGIILLGLNLVRYLHKIPTNWFSITLGAIALVLGAAKLLTWQLLRLHVELEFFPIVLVVIGVTLLIRAAATRERTAQP